MTVACVDDGRSSTRILIVEDDEAMARCLARIGKPFGDVTVEGSVSGALAQLARHARWDAFIVDLGLPDGYGRDVVSGIRMTARNAPVLILSGAIDHDAIHLAFDLRASYLHKPATAAQLERFLRSATTVAPARPGFIALPREPEGLLAERVCELASSHKLSPIEADLVDACLHGFSGKEYLELHAVSINTYKTRVRRVLRKLRASSLGEIRDRLLRSL